MPSVLWHCWLGARTSIRTVRIEWWGVDGYLFGARCPLFAYGPADATAISKPHHLLPHSNPDWLYLSGTGLPRLSWKRAHSMGVVEKRRLNVCLCVCSSIYLLSFRVDAGADPECGGCRCYWGEVPLWPSPVWTGPAISPPPRTCQLSGQQ